MIRIVVAKLFHCRFRHPAGDDGLPGFADDAIARTKAVGIGAQRLAQWFDARPDCGDSPGAGDGNVGFVHGCFHNGSHALMIGCMNFGQVSNNSPVGVVNTWLVLPVASCVPSPSRRTS